MFEDPKQLITAIIAVIYPLLIALMDKVNELIKALTDAGLPDWGISSMTVGLWVGIVWKLIAEARANRAKRKHYENKKR